MSAIKHYDGYWPVSQNWPVKPGLHLQWFGLSQCPFMHFGWQTALKEKIKKLKWWRIKVYGC